MRVDPQAVQPIVAGRCPSPHPDPLPEGEGEELELDSPLFMPPICRHPTPHIEFYMRIGRYLAPRAALKLEATGSAAHDRSPYV